MANIGNGQTKDKMVKYIDCGVPTKACTLRCHYCYLAQQEKTFEHQSLKLKYSADTIGKALSKKRLGGTCFINFCGNGETLLPPEMTDIITKCLEQGHFVTIVTNGTVSKRFDELLSLPKDYIERIFFKFSYHYLELKRLNLLDTLFDNINKVKQAGGSFSLELGASDEYIPYLDEIKELTMQKLGALPHIVVLRDDSQPDIPILTNLSREEYLKTWRQFNSNMFEFQISVYNKKRTEFCYAGLWTSTLDLANGQLKQCYKAKLIQNIFEDIEKPINFSPVGNACPEPHCFNAHMFLIFGLIPEHLSYTYTDVRNRVCTDGTQWLNERMKAAFSQRFCENNKNYTPLEKWLYMHKDRLTLKNLIQHIFSIKNQNIDGRVYKKLTLLGFTIKYSKRNNGAGLRGGVKPRSPLLYCFSN